MENCKIIKKAIKEIGESKIIEMAMGHTDLRFLDHAITRTWRKDYIRGHMNLEPNDIPYGELWAYPYGVFCEDLNSLTEMNTKYGIGFEILSPEQSEYGQGTWKVILKEPLEKE